eukprot:4018047-Pyramimonas_sp.AAC.1
MSSEDSNIIGKILGTILARCGGVTHADPADDGAGEHAGTHADLADDGAEERTGARADPADDGAGEHDGVAPLR